MKSTTTRYLNGTLNLYQVTTAEDRLLKPVATYAIKSDDKELSHAVAPDLSRLVYATSNSIICFDRKGDARWRYDLEPLSTAYRVRPPDFAFSLDGTWLWVYRPDAINDRGPDTLVTLRVSTGEVVAKAELDSVGEGGRIALHRDDRHILLGVGEGQDGARVYLAALSASHDSIELHSYEWNDRVLIDTSPDGSQFMTVDHGRDDVAFHTFPSGEIALCLPIDAFEDEDEEPLIDYAGGFLNSDTAVVTLAGEKDDKEWHRHYRIDLRTRRPQGRFEAYSRDSYDFEPLGDGTWIVSGADGRPIRHKLSV